MKNIQCDRIDLPNHDLHTLHDIWEELEKLRVHFNMHTSSVCFLEYS